MATPKPRRNRASPTLARQSGSTGVVAAFAVVSGVLLDGSIAAVFGAGRETDALFVALRVPLIAAVMVAAVANNALVPAFARWLELDGAATMGRRVSQVLTIVAGVAAACGAAVVIVAQPFVELAAPGLSTGQTAAAARMVEALAVVLPLVAVTEVLRAYLNARGSFAAPAGLNVALNLVAAVGVLTVARGRGVETVAWAYVAGATARTLYAVVLSVRRGFRFRPGRPDRPAAEVLDVLRLALWPLGAGALMPTARLVEQAVASFLPAGSITILNYGHRLVMAIGGSVFFRSVSLPLVPRLAAATVASRVDLVASTTTMGLRILAFVSVPVSVFLIVLSGPIATLVFERGSFGRGDSQMLAGVIAVLSLGLVGSAIQRAFLAPSLARLDMPTLLRNSMYGAVANIVLVLLFVLPLRGTWGALLAVALANAVAQYVMAAHSFRAMPPVARAAVQAPLAAFRGLWGPAVAAGLAMWGLEGALDVMSLPAGVQLAGRALLIGVLGSLVFVLGLWRPDGGPVMRLVWEAPTKRSGGRGHRW